MNQPDKLVKSGIIALTKGRHREGTPDVGASAVLPRGFARRAGAASGIMSFGTMADARGAAAGLGQADTGNARKKPRPRKPGLELSQETEVSWREPRRSAGRRAASARSRCRTPLPVPPPQGGRE
jgi:hypothetical protein